MSLMYRPYVRLPGHDGGAFAEYAHLAKKSALVNVNEKIAAGQTLPLSGNTGFSRGPHLHLRSS